MFDWRTVLNRRAPQLGVFLAGARHLRRNPLALWKDDAEFQAVMRGVRGRTLVDERRCFILWQLAHQVATLGGEVAEIGVYRGGTARLLARAFGKSGKRVHLFDTFEGMPEADATLDHHVRGEFGDAPVDDVRGYLSDCKNVELHPGHFPATAAVVAASSFAFVHVDTDINQSVADCCEFFYPRLDPGGVMAFDDYGFVSCPGAKKAVDDFFAGRRERPVYLPTGQAVVTRLPDA